MGNKGEKTEFRQISLAPELDLPRLHLSFSRRNCHAIRRFEHGIARPVRYCSRNIRFPAENRIECGLERPAQAILFNSAQ
jgi:hypothetical protein